MTWVFRAGKYRVIVTVWPQWCFNTSSYKDPEGNCFFLHWPLGTIAWFPEILLPSVVAVIVRGHR